LNKILLFVFILVFAVINVHGQATSKNLIGKWMLTKIVFPAGVAFNTDSLTDSYRQFFNKQK
jgi:uncharacterized integral membrane protein